MTYSVVDRTPPTITVASPAQGAVYLLGETVAASYSCGEDAFKAATQRVYRSAAMPSGVTLRVVRP